MGELDIVKGSVTDAKADVIYVKNGSTVSAPISDENEYLETDVL